MTNVGYTALGIIQAAGETDAPLMDVASLYFAMGERLELDWFSGQILASKVENEWQALARDTYLEDLEWQQRTLAVGALRHMCEDRNLLTCMKRWEKQEATLLARWQEMLTELHATERLILPCLPWPIGNCWIWRKAVPGRHSLRRGNPAMVMC